MKIVQAPRASAILYQLITSQADKRPWLLPANICPIVPITFLKADVPFEWVDISAETLNMDLDQAAALIKSQKFGGLLYAHTYGEASTPNDFFSLLSSIVPELLIVDDRCLCIPDLESDPKNLADVQLYSTGYAKIAELNFGGYAFLDDQVNYQRQHLLFNAQDHDAIEKSYKDAVSQHRPYVYRDSDWLETETVMPSWQDYQQQIKSNLSVSLEHRRQLIHTYKTLLPVEVQLPDPYQTWRFNIRLKNRDQVLAAIFSKGLFASAHYASLTGIIGEGNAPHAEALSNKVINLFNDHHFSLSQAEQVCKIILEYVP